MEDEVVSINETVIDTSKFNEVNEDSAYYVLAPAMCHIAANNGKQGTGFLFKIFNYVGLFTNHHVLNGSEDYFLTPEVSRTTVYLSQSDVQWHFTDSDLDVSFFVFNENVYSILKETIFLQKWENDLVNNKDMAVLQYPSLTNDVLKNIRGSSNALNSTSIHKYKLLEASGIVTGYRGHIIKHSVSTARGSSGGLIVSQNTKKVLCIHKAGFLDDSSDKNNFSIRIRDVIEIIHWEICDRILYSEKFLQEEDEQVQCKLPINSWCNITFVSSIDVKTMGFLCTLQNENKCLKGIFATSVSGNLREEFRVHFPYENITLDVKSEDIGLVFTKKKLPFTFMAFTEHFIKTIISKNKLKFLSAAVCKENLYLSKVIVPILSNKGNGHVSEEDEDHFFIREVEACPIGSPILNEEKKAIGILEKNGTNKHTIRNMKAIEAFIFKKRHYGQLHTRTAVCKVTDLCMSSVTSTTTGFLASFVDQHNNETKGLFKFGSNAQFTSEMYFETCNKTFAIDSANSTSFDVGFNYVFVTFNETLLQELSTHRLTFLRINIEEPVLSSTVFVRYYSNGRAATTTKGSIIGIHSKEILHDACTGADSTGAPILNENFEVIAIHSEQPPNQIIIHLDKGDSHYHRGIRIGTLVNNILSFKLQQSLLHLPEGLRVIEHGNQHLGLAPAICQIVANQNIFSTAFMFKLSDFSGLFTTHNALRKLSSFQLSIQATEINRLITPEDISWFFTDRDLDVTFLVFNENILSQLNTSIFLEGLENDANVDEDVVLFQCPVLTHDTQTKLLEFPNWQNRSLNYVLCEASGTVTKYCGHFIQYRVDSAPGSSGGALIEQKTKKVIAVHSRKMGYLKSGTNIRHAVKIICWEANNRKLYSSNLLQEDEEMRMKPPQASVCVIKQHTDIFNGFLCTLQDGDTMLKGIFTTYMDDILIEPLNVHFPGVKSVRSEDIVLFFIDKRLCFTFMVFSEKFCSSHKLKFLATSASEPSYMSEVYIQEAMSQAVPGIISEIDDDRFYIRTNSQCSIGTPTLNKENEVIGIVVQALNNKLIAINIQEIKKFISKKRIYVPEFPPPPEKKFRTDGSPTE